VYPFINDINQSHPVYKLLQRERKIYVENMSKILHQYIVSENILHEPYLQYQKIFHIMISNPNTQFTGSFHPTHHKLSNYYHKPSGELLHLIYPEIMCILRCTLPKPLRYMILKYWAQTLLIQF